MAHPPLKAITLTHVRYTKGDRLGLFLAWISLVPVFISFAGFFSHFVFRRDLQGVFFLIGLVISQFINEFIKTTVQQARPVTCALLEACDSHGWPSSHAQFMFFFATYFSLLSARKARVCRGGCRNIFVELVNWILAVLTMYSRVYLGYHSVVQVFAGAFAGIVIGASWFFAVYRTLINYFTVIEESDLGRRLYIKDTSHIANVMKFEYDNARAARKECLPQFLILKRGFMELLDL
ncbi:hypothetical protein V2J09_010549 [Rumex salicifolius]